MQTKPIMFSKPMLEAIRQGRKRVTRRQWKGRPYCEVGTLLWVKENGLFSRKEDTKLWLEVLEVRVEPLNNLSESEAILEGFNSVEEFKALFDSLYPNQPAKQWDANPLVSVITFKVVRGGHDAKRQTLLPVLG